MAVAKGAKTIGAPFSNTVEVVRVMYDFSVDTGAVADYTLLTADGPCLVRCIGASVEAGLTSGGAATLELGKGASGAEFITAEAYTSFALNGFYASESAAFVKLADTNIINLGIAGAALTAGKVEFIFEVAQA